MRTANKQPHPNAGVVGSSALFRAAQALSHAANTHSIEGKQNWAAAIPTDATTPSQRSSIQAKNAERALEVPGTSRARTGTRSDGARLLGFDWLQPW